MDENCTNYNHAGRVIHDRNYAFAGRMLVVVCIHCGIDYRVIIGKEKDVDHSPWVLDAADDYLKAQVLNPT